MEVYALTGASASRTRLHVAAARGLTRFVGRDAEIEQIRRALTLAHDGRGQLVALVGEPGVGKSRLVYEFTHSHRTQDCLILEAGSVSYGKATSYQALTTLQLLPETRQTLEQAIDLRFDLRTALFPLGEFERIAGCLREAEGLARTLDDQRRLGLLERELSRERFGSPDFLP